jgi:hypothetical protein
MRRSQLPKNGLLRFGRQCVESLGSFLGLEVSEFVTEI